MIVAAVQHVMVDRDQWDWLFDSLGAVGGLAGAVAIWYSANARKEIVKERGRLFELDILREIVTEIDNGFLYRISDDPERLRKFARRLDFLPVRDLPFWREMMDTRYFGEATGGKAFIEQQIARSAVVREIVARTPAKDAPDAELADWKAEYDGAVESLQLSAHDFREGVSKRLLDELVHAITVRVEAGRVEVGRGFWARLRRRGRFGR